MYRKFFTVLIIITCGQVCASIREFEELPNEILFHFEKSLPKNYDLDVQNALQALNVTLQRFNEFQSRNGGFESRDAVINSRIDERTYAKIDNCCRMHDECPDYVLRSDDYKRYPGLDVRPQFFSRLKCSCDTDFYQCLETINTNYAYSIGIGYGIFQRYCFEYEHPIIECTEYYTGFGFRRCMAYQVNYDAPKRWQWFDVLPPYLEVNSFPQFIQNAFSFK